MIKFKRTNGYFRSLKQNIFVFYLSPEQLVDNKKNQRLISTTEISILIFINMNCKTWPIVDLELNP